MWSDKINKYRLECLKHFESYRGNVPAEKDFTHSLIMFQDSVRAEALQRGRQTLIKEILEEIEKRQTKLNTKNIETTEGKFMELGVNTALDSLKDYLLNRKEE